MQYKLIRPFEGIGGKIEVVQVREYRTAEDMLEASRADNDVDAAIITVGRLCGLERTEALELDLRDLNALIALIPRVDDPKE